MKTFDAGLAADYASGLTTLAYCLELKLRDGVTAFRFTSATKDIVVDGDAYLGGSGLDINGLASTSDFSVGSPNLTIFPDGDTVLEADLEAGKWDFATYRLFECNYVDPTRGINVLRRGWTGEADSQVGSYTLELRNLKQALQQNIGRVTQKTCPYRLGSTSRPLGLCLIDLTPFTHTYAVTAVASRREFTCSAAVEVDDYYGEGSATSLDAANAGYAQKIKTFAAGVFTLSLEMPFDVEIGDTFSFVAGCRKRFTEDCQTKFANALNFGGDKDVPGADAITADPQVSVS